MEKKKKSFFLFFLLYCLILLEALVVEEKRLGESLENKRSSATCIPTAMLLQYSALQS